MDVREIIIALGALCALWIAFTAVTLVALYWTHYPYGKKWRRKWPRK